MRLIARRYIQRRGGCRGAGSMYFSQRFTSSVHFRPDGDLRAVPVYQANWSGDLQSVVLGSLTGWGQHEDRRRTTEAGFNYHFVKPLHPTELAKAMAELEGREER